MYSTSMYWCTLFKGFEFFRKSYTTLVALATVTFRDGGYFGFKAIKLENDIGDLQILLHKNISLSMLN